MIDVATIRSAIECGLRQNERCVYLSHPLTTGGRSIAKNIARAQRMTLAIRLVDRRDIVNPTGIGPIEGWDQAMWMSLWLPFIRDRVRTVVLASDWQTSRGCTLERDCALQCGALIVDYATFVGATA